MGVKIKTHSKYFALRGDHGGTWEVYSPGFIPPCLAMEALHCSCSCGPRGPGYCWQQALASPMWYLVSRNTVCLSYGVNEAALRFQRKTWNIRKCVAGSEFLWATHASVMQGVLRAKLKYTGDSRKLEMPAMWNVCWDKHQVASRASLSEVMLVVVNKFLRAGLPQVRGSHFPLPCAPGAGKEAIGLNVCPYLSVLLWPYSFFLFLYFSIWNGNVYSLSLSVGCAFDIYRGKHPRVFLESPMRFWTWTFGQCWN